MILNSAPWELVKGSKFVVGDRALVKDGVTIHPGEEYPIHADERTIFELYVTNAITPTVKTEESEPKRKGKGK